MRQMSSGGQIQTKSAGEGGNAGNKGGIRQTNKSVLKICKLTGTNCFECSLSDCKVGGR